MNIEEEKTLEQICLLGWKSTYRISEDDRAATAWARDLAERTTIPGDTNSKISIFTNRLLFGVKWLHCGRVKLVTSHTYAAALMASTVTENISEDMILPWKAFRVELPSGLLATDQLQFEAIDVGVYENVDRGCCINLRGRRVSPSSGNTYFIRAVSDPALMFFSKDVEPEVVGDIVDFDVKERAMRLAIRLVTGLLYTVQHTDNFKNRTYKGTLKGGSGRDGPPSHRIYYVGKPLKYDCRPAVSHYLSGHRVAPPSVQSMVRGHYKRQVIGVGRAGRKVIWVEPYWRGPEDAPILARPYHVGS